ncbi:MAG: hypothetical protein AAGA48_25015 [Myxococcota bacterium]
MRYGQIDFKELDRRLHALRDKGGPRSVKALIEGYVDCDGRTPSTVAREVSRRRTHTQSMRFLYEMDDNQVGKLLRQLAAGLTKAGVRTEPSDLVIEILCPVHERDRARSAPLAKDALDRGLEVLGRTELSSIVGDLVLHDNGVEPALRSDLTFVLRRAADGSREIESGDERIYTLGISGIASNGETLLLQIARSVVFLRVKGLRVHIVPLLTRDEFALGSAIQNWRSGGDADHIWWKLADVSAPRAVHDELDAVVLVGAEALPEWAHSIAVRHPLLALSPGLADPLVGCERFRSLRDALSTWLRAELRQFESSRSERWKKTLYRTIRNIVRYREEDDYLSRLPVVIRDELAAHPEEGRKLLAGVIDVAREHVRMDAALDAMLGKAVDAVHEALTTRRVSVRPVNEGFRSMYRNVLLSYPGATLHAASLPSRDYFWDEAMMGLMKKFVDAGGTMKRVFFLDEKLASLEETKGILAAQQKCGVEVFTCDWDKAREHGLVRFYIVDNKARFVLDACLGIHQEIISVTGHVDRDTVRGFLEDWNALCEMSDEFQL